MSYWASLREKMFNFCEIRYFDTSGQTTRLMARAMTAPAGLIRSP
jgi:4-hydroxyphenylpyruvate dioxygenase